MGKFCAPIITGFWVLVKNKSWLKTGSRLKQSNIYGHSQHSSAYLVTNSSEVTMVPRNTFYVKLNLFVQTVQRRRDEQTKRYHKRFQAKFCCTLY